MGKYEVRKNLIEQQKNHFNSIAKQYFEARKDKNHLFYKSLLWKNFFMVNSYLKKKDSLSVLEPMCGYGEGRKILQKFLDTDIIYEGFDYSDELVNSVLKENKTLNIFVQDITKFKPQKTYDVVIVIGGLHHIPEFVQESLEIIKKSLKKGGVFINFEPTHNCYPVKKIREKIYQKNKLFDEETEKDFSLKEINKLYTDAGFTIKNQSFPGLFAYILYYNPDAFPLLNIGGKLLVKFLFECEKLLAKTFIGRKLSFTTLTVLENR